MKDRENEQEMSINEAEYVPHPKDGDSYALFLHEPYHLLSKDDITKNEETQ
ncbi:transcriptional regulator SplA domain-containing protein [Metabacillus arenae]|uniref:Uncharacterized protein n=1 Tax=Metabacillus arenae TaxID=2771434 RepID=A0A926NBC2_9BACI|nr:transcriptional regulator SplA domain-containing protein [Metabacillus arenae]MBD1380324.1 hypothetical protein [Metabacillus arenae]